MTNTPGERAKALVQSADANYRQGKIKSASEKLKEAFALKDMVESYSGPQWQQNHHNFTAAMLDMSVLLYKLGNFAYGDSIAARAQAWADDPNCSSQKNFEQSFHVRRNKVRYFLSGLFARFCSILPAC